MPSAAQEVLEAAAWDEVPEAWRNERGRQTRATLRGARDGLKALMTLDGRAMTVVERKAPALLLRTLARAEHGHRVRFVDPQALPRRDHTCCLGKHDKVPALLTAPVRTVG